MTAASGGLSAIRAGAVPIAWLITILVLAQPSEAQLFERALVIENARIVSMAGPAIEKGSLLIRGGRIAAMGDHVEVPMLARRINAAGKTITPGMIDAWSALGSLGGSETVDTTASAWDNFDVYSDHDVRAALANGVTAMYLAPASGTGISGMGLVVRLAVQDDGTIGKPMVEEAALAIDLASAQQSIARLKLFSKIRKKFQVALDYQDAQELYEEELKEYLKKLEAETAKAGSESDKKNKAQQGKAADKTADKKKNAEPTPEPDKPKEDPTPKPKPKDAQPHTFSTAMHLQGIHYPVAEGDESKPAKTSEPSGQDEKKKDEVELEKPTKPKRDPESEVLIKALDRQVPVRIRADRSSDMLNAIELAEEFNLRLIIEGATEAHLLSAQLAEAEVTVVLGPSVRGSAYAEGPYRRHLSANGSALTAAGVEWTIGSGANSSRAARYVGLNAQLASAHDDSSDDWLRLVTVNAAKMLGVSDQLGKLTRGRSADFVIWDGDPSDPGSKVDRVYVAGKEAYVATGK